MGAKQREATVCVPLCNLTRAYAITFSPSYILLTGSQIDTSWINPWNQFFYFNLGELTLSENGIVLIRGLKIQEINNYLIWATELVGFHNNMRKTVETVWVPCN